jgi:hypothetical protein
MRLYTVHAPPPVGDQPPDPLGYVFVKDGFCWPALFLPELWLLFRRMWLVFLLYLLVALVVYAFDQRYGGSIGSVFVGLARLLFALEGNGLRRWTLAGKGYRLVGVATGKDRDEAEVRFFYESERAIRAPEGRDESSSVRADGVIRSAEPVA